MSVVIAMGQSKESVESFRLAESYWRESLKGEKS